LDARRAHTTVRTPFVVVAPLARTSAAAGKWCAKSVEAAFSGVRGGSIETLGGRGLGRVQSSVGWGKPQGAIHNQRINQYTVTKKRKKKSGVSWFFSFFACVATAADAAAALSLAGVVCTFDLALPPSFCYLEKGFPSTKPGEGSRHLPRPPRCAQKASISRLLICLLVCPIQFPPFASPQTVSVGVGHTPRCQAGRARADTYTSKARR
jgi:hypothetical protein